MNTEHVTVLGLADNADGNAYPTAVYTVIPQVAFTTALTALRQGADHVLILDPEDFRTREATYTSLAPYAIHISKGIHA